MTEAHERAPERVPGVTASGSLDTPTRSRVRLLSRRAGREAGSGTVSPRATLPSRPAVVRRSGGRRHLGSPRTARHVFARSLHDVGLAAWFGGSLMGAVGLNGAAASLRDPDERAVAATAGWTRWAPVSTVAIGAHLLGAGRLLRTEQYRVRRQKGVARSSAVKTALTVAALGATAYSGVLNRQMAAAGNVPVRGATEPGAGTPPEVAQTQKRLKAVQWLIPGLTGSLVAATAWQSEQMRPRQVLRGMLPSSGAALPVLAVVALVVLRRRAQGGRQEPVSAAPGSSVRSVDLPDARTTSATDLLPQDETTENTAAGATPSGIRSSRP